MFACFAIKVSKLFINCLIDYFAIKVSKTFHKMFACLLVVDFKAVCKTFIKIKIKQLRPFLLVVPQ